MKNRTSLKIPLDYIDEGLHLIIDERTPGTLFIANDYVENFEAQYQLKEGFFYDYEFSREEYSFGDNPTIQPNVRKKYLGILSPNIYVGTLYLTILYKGQYITKNLLLEVQSIKTGYREDYRDMLEFISEQCTELLLQTDSPVSQYFDVDFARNSDSLYQQFSFVKSIILTDEFNEALHRIIKSPVTKWINETELCDVHNIKRIRNKHLREIISGSDRVALHKEHALQNYGIDSIPLKVNSVRKHDSVDAPENRFIKHVLETFLKFSTEIHNIAEKFSLKQLADESDLLQKKIEMWLQYSVFKEVSRPSSLKINSPILQRKEGYREVLRVWLMFDLAAKLIWQGGDNVYSAGKKDVSVLYEYWLFFKLLNLFKSMFGVESTVVSQLIKHSSDGLNLTLKQGRHTAIKGIFSVYSRKLNVHFHYNRSYNGSNTETSYPSSGSWTTSMRPDYTLSFWPCEISEAEAEKQELIVHIHFDAKYKIANLTDLITHKDDEQLNVEKEDNRKGIYKNADLLKMHAYKDAIRRTAGAYILYPGGINFIRQGFHEIIPGLGAFSIRPSKNDDGIGDLKEFIDKIIKHFCNRATQRERIAYKSFQVYKDKQLVTVDEPMPEPLGENRDLIPDDTYVLVAFYKKENWDWIIKSGLYNVRAGTDRGSLRLGPGESGARYVLLHTKDEIVSTRLLKIVEKGPRIFSKQQLIEKSYPSNPTQDFYLVYKVSDEVEVEIKNIKWDVSKLEGYLKGRNSALPFTVTLSELLRSKVKNW
jgi:hypothetical protein